MINSVNSFVLAGVQPMLTCYLMIDIKTARTRMQNRGQQLSTFDQERESFFERVVAGYEALYRNRTDVLRLDARQQVDDLADLVVARIEQLIECDGYDTTKIRTCTTVDRCSKDITY